MNADTFDERLAAVERTLTDSETAPGSLAEEADLQQRLATVEARIDALETRLADVEGEVTAVRAHVDDARRVDRETERVAERALALAREQPTEPAPPTSTRTTSPVSRLVARLRALVS
ncbi:DUF7310 family coiled-coil domain-containing protein [Halosegnis longus]|uniref:DUF7310 domain-containing protein n=1 Tax=Halosegnis longus TaxID=2216012 RepID=A0AAJ4UWK5_9EURY|nr:MULTISPECIES: hypothetical protein [Halobacteriales]RNJ26994.1 hypothetical protein Nmn1133_10060 [Salella cibi]